MPTTVDLQARGESHIDPISNDHNLLGATREKADIRANPVKFEAPTKTEPPVNNAVILSHPDTMMLSLTPRRVPGVCQAIRWQVCLRSLFYLINLVTDCISIE